MQNVEGGVRIRARGAYHQLQSQTNREKKMTNRRLRDGVGNARGFHMKELCSNPTRPSPLFYHTLLSAKVSGHSFLSSCAQFQNVPELVSCLKCRSPFCRRRKTRFTFLFKYVGASSNN